MKFILLSFISFLIAVSGPANTSQVNADDGLTKRGWLAFGDMRGYFEPCGCDPEADLGGVQRIATFLKRERAVSPGFYLFNLGNNLPVELGRDRYKVPYIEEALSSFGITASLVNELEISNIKLISQRYQVAQNFVLSNMVSNPKGSSISNKIVTAGVEVYGYMYRPKLSKVLISDQAKLLKLWRANSKTKKASQRVLLFSGSSKELEYFYKSKFFNLIISANQNPLDIVVGPTEKDDPGKLKTGIADVRMVPIGGQGLLRGGRLTAVRSKSLKELLGKRIECSDLLTGNCSEVEGTSMIKTPEEYQLSWLDQQFKNPDNLANLYARYQKAGDKVFKGLSEVRKADLKSSPFIGAEACKSCHKSAYDVWSKSGHHHALSTLEKVNKNRDPECVSCHVLGYQDKGGFVSEKESPQFANVQCENCHGSRKQHVKNPTVYPKKKIDAKAVCTSCHHGTHTSDFDFNKYWSKIKH